MRVKNYIHLVYCQQPFRSAILKNRVLFFIVYRTSSYVLLIFQASGSVSSVASGHLRSLQSPTPTQRQCFLGMDVPGVHQRFYKKILTSSGNHCACHIRIQTELLYTLQFFFSFFFTFQFLIQHFKHCL